MSKSHARVAPKTFFLNEQHELPHDEKPGGGRLPQFADIDWAQKGQNLSQTLSVAAEKLDESRDPLRGQRYFLLAVPTSVEKKSTDKKKAPTGTFVEETDFSAAQSRVLGRLGLDLIEVTRDGNAVVHARPERLEQLKLRSGLLDELGAQSKLRWATLGSFDTIPPALRMDAEWWRSLKRRTPAEAIVELQPLLTRSEVEEVMRAIADRLLDKNAERLTGTGSDLSGRYWLRASISPESLREIAKDFFSVQSLHGPLYSTAAALHRPRIPGWAPSEVSASAAHVPATLPCVGVIDSGVPDGHVLLGPFRRGTFIAPTSIGRAVGDHGSKVASRVVFGENDFSAGVTPVTGSCRYLDVQLSQGFGQYDDKAIPRALDGAVRANPDVRVFNISLADGRAVGLYAPVERRERLLMLQDVEDLIFETDVIVVVAAGNIPFGVVPNRGYPDHFDDPEWGLGVWACGFNTLVCGAYVGRVGVAGLADVGWPSPFTRIGPGIAQSPVPGYSAPGGNATANYQFQPGLGEWVCNDAGMWEDHSGTSYAAPLLAREAAVGLQILQQFCDQGARPFGVTLKAFFAITAARLNLPRHVQALADRTLGRGRASATRLAAPHPDDAILLWQGMIEGPRDEVSIQLPIPIDWFNEAQQPTLRLVVCSDPPVNEAAHSLWACRRVSAKLRIGPDEKAVRAHANNHISYPIVDRTYDLRKATARTKIGGSAWLLELSYDEIADYRVGSDFTPQQRVAFAAQLFDAAEAPVSPQPAMQALPIAFTMQRLSLPTIPVRLPVILTTGI